VRIDATFVTSAASASDLPREGFAEIALVGRSNVGKSSLINALVRQRVARTSAAPGKTRLANVYRVNRGAAPPFHLVDLPGYGYARGGDDSARAFEELTRAYFGPERRERQEGLEGNFRPRLPASPADPGRPSVRVSALLLVDARHPGLESDIEAWKWLRHTVARCAMVATKIDKLARGERIRAMRQLESVCETSVVPVSAATGEGLDELWRMIDRLNSPVETAPQPRLPNEPPSGRRTRLRKR
jgi:GTP-binding protein